MHHSVNPIGNLTRGVRLLSPTDVRERFTKVGNKSLAERVGMEGFGSNSFAEGFGSNRALVHSFAEGFAAAAPAPEADQIFTGGGLFSLRGPGRNNFLCADNFRVVNRPFENTPDFRAKATFSKVFPICGTKGYFSLRLVSAPALYLVANNGNVEVGPVDSIISTQNSACWQTVKCGSEENAVSLTNKAFPGLVLTVVDDNTIRMLQSSGSGEKVCISEERGLSSYAGTPYPRPPILADFEVRNGWLLSNLNRKFGPTQFRSYELDPRTARTYQECAAEVAKHREANGFIFLPEGSYSGKNCRIMAGGFWPLKPMPPGNENRVISGRVRGTAAQTEYRDPIESFEIRTGWGVKDINTRVGANPSYELDQRNTPTAEGCAAEALRDPRANSFIFIPGDKLNCRVKVGGFWPEKQSEVQATFTAGILKK